VAGFVREIIHVDKVGAFFMRPLAKKDTNSLSREILNIRERFAGNTINSLAG